MTKYNKYQDYVIKDGKLIGEFEAMYKDYENPWKQSTREKDAIEKLIKGCGFLHTLITYGQGEQKYGLEYFTNLEEIKKYWSDTIEIYDWGNIGNTDYNGGNRTFFYGKIK